MATKQNQQLLILGLLLAILVSAMDNTIVATSMGTIVRDLNGFDQFVWVTSAYMVAVMAGMPIFGKLSDMYGRKRFFIFGLTVFLLGSILCGTANSVIQLSIYRAVQGIGGGALMPIAFTIVFDIYPPEKRGKMTALFGATFGIASVLGPLMGAIITEHINWHWIFYVNVPIGLISMLLVLTNYREATAPRKQSIDWFGAITLVVGVVSLMFALELGGKQFEWVSVQSFSLFGLFIVMFIAFLFIEKRATDPIISFDLFRKRLFASSQAIAFCYGAIFIPLTVFIPIFIQATHGGTPIESALILTPMMLGSVAGSAISGITQTKTSFRRIMTASVIILFVGMTLMSTIDPNTSRMLITLYMIFCGLGVGFSFSLLPTASVHQVDPRFRGSANSTNSFFRSLGMTIGISIFGSIQNKIFNNDLASAFKGQGQNFMQGTKDVSEIFSSKVRAQIPDAVIQKILDALSHSITTVFLLNLGFIVLAAIAIYQMGDARIIVKKDDQSKQAKGH